MAAYSDLIRSVGSVCSGFLFISFRQIEHSRTDREPLEQYISFRVRDIAAPLLSMVLSIENWIQYGGCR